MISEQGLWEFGAFYPAFNFSKDDMLNSLGRKCSPPPPPPPFSTTLIFGFLYLFVLPCGSSGIQADSPVDSRRAFGAGV